MKQSGSIPRVGEGEMDLAGDHADYGFLRQDLPERLMPERISQPGRGRLQAGGYVSDFGERKNEVHYSISVVMPQQIGHDGDLYSGQQARSKGSPTKNQ